jgi:hypothetical protein
MLTAAEVDLDGEVAAALARSWDAIRARHDEVPPVMLAVVSHRCRARKRCLGAFVPARWLPTHAYEPPELQVLREEFDDAIARGDLVAAMGASGEAVLIGALQLSADASRWLDEVFLTDDGLCGSAADVLGTLLHEAGHALAHVRGVRDTSRQGRYHNARFKSLAEELGLEVRQDPVIGWSQTTLTPDTAVVYGDTLTELTRALDHRGQRPSTTPSHADDMLGCKCGEWLRAGHGGTPGLCAATCGICGARLRELTGSRTA